MGIIAWIVLGLIAGLLAKLVVPGPDPGGIIVTIIVGIVGGLLGGFIGQLLGFGGVNGINLGSIILAVIGSVILLLIYRAVAGRAVWQRLIERARVKWKPWLYLYSYWSRISSVGFTTRGPCKALNWRNHLIRSSIAFTASRWRLGSTWE
jgi:uncharacterized membrane protein YeaQ/YmgE (transglycosylase-associated protein family)